MVLRRYFPPCVSFYTIPKGVGTQHIKNLASCVSSRRVHPSVRLNLALVLRYIIIPLAYASYFRKLKKGPWVECRCRPKRLCGATDYFGRLPATLCLTLSKTTNVGCPRRCLSLQPTMSHFWQNSVWYSLLMSPLFCFILLTKYLLSKKTISYHTYTRLVKIHQCVRPRSVYTVSRWARRKTLTWRRLIRRRFRRDDWHANWGAHPVFARTVK